MYLFIFYFGRPSGVGRCRVLHPLPPGVGSALSSLGWCPKKHQRPVIIKHHVMVVKSPKAVIPHQNQQEQHDQHDQWKHPNYQFEKYFQGKIWPAPKEQKSVEEFLVLRSNSFRFEVTPSPLIIFINRKAVFSKCTDSLVLVQWLL